MSLSARPSEEAPAAVAGDLGPELLRPARVDVHLDRIRHNLGVLRGVAGPAGVLAVVKADAYGHGAVEVARCLEGVEGVERVEGVDRIDRVDWLGVAMVEEGAELRRAGVGLPILVLGPTYEGQQPLLRRYRLVPTVSSLEQLRAWGEWARAQEVRQDIHLKLDTGMTRLGIGVHELGAALESLRSSGWLRLAGLASHLAESADLDSPQNARQIEEFSQAAATLRGAQSVQSAQRDQRDAVILHLANSGGALHHPASRHDLVRAGLSLYGHDPARLQPDLRPAMEVRARVTLVRHVEAGTRLGYGGRRQMSAPGQVAVVPMGYADGYDWRLSDRATALLRGRRVEVLGAVSMDMTLIDASATGATVGDEVVLLGRQGGEEITVQELAERAGTIPYETLCGFALRLPRFYWEDGALVGWRSRHRGGA